MAERSPVVIGLDVGTTSAKAAAFQVGGGSGPVAIREYPLLHPAPDQQVQDPATIVGAAGEAVSECVAGVGSARVLALGLAAGMHGLMALDAGLRPLTPLVTWADARARDEAAALRRSDRAGELQARSGVPIHPMTPLTKLMWFKRHDPATWSAARWWVGLKDYLLLSLTGTLATELSSASGTGLCDITTRTWSAVALSVSGVSSEQLPEILPTTAVLELSGAAAERTGLRAGTPVVAGAGDGPLGNLGTGAIAPGIAGLSLGTSGAVRMAVDAPLVEADRTLFCYALTDRIWVIGGAISNGGVVLRWAGESLAPDAEAAAGEAHRDAAVLELAASVPAGSDGLVFLPYLLAERAPLWNPGLPAAYLGLRREHTRAHMIRAAVEGVCLQMRLILDSLERVEAVNAVRVTGGVFRAPLWQAVMAAVLGRRLELVGDEEGTALGAAALALLALGVAPSLEEARAKLADPSAAASVIEPDPREVETYERLRASVPELLAALGGVAELFADAAAPERSRAAATRGLGPPRPARRP